MASALGVPLVLQPEYPSISWGTDPRVTSHELTKLNYLFFTISCHCIWPISHLHTILIERCGLRFIGVVLNPMACSF